VVAADYPVGAWARHDASHDEALDGEKALRALPKAAAGLLDAAREAGWLWALSWQADTSGNPFVSLHLGYLEDAPAEDPDMLAALRAYQIRATWHTRDTGTLRLFSLIVQQPRQDWRDRSVKAALQLISEHREAR
jgi:hypothetical protein